MTADPRRWRLCLLPQDATIQDAIQCLNRSSLQIVLVVDPGELLVGTVTDGDIRRGLLRDATMTSPVAPIVRRNPLVVPPEIQRDSVLQLMRSNAFSAIPIVDASRRVVGLHILNELLAPARRANLMLIMAGGRGARLRPHTDHCPKPLLPVAGKPMLEHVIERAKGEGFERFVVAVHYLGHMIEEHFGDGSRLQVRIDYLREESPLGTAGALKLLSPAPDEPFVVTNGDVLTDIHYGELIDFHARHGAAATMAVRVHEWQHPFGVVRTKGVDIVGFDEKPIVRSHINAGVYVLEPSAIEAIDADGPCDMPMLFARLQERGARTIVYPMHEPWIDAGGVEDLARARADHVRKATT